MQNNHHTSPCVASLSFRGQIFQCRPTFPFSFLFRMPIERIKLTSFVGFSWPCICYRYLDSIGEYYKKIQSIYWWFTFFVLKFWFHYTFSQYSEYDFKKYHIWDNYYQLGNLISINACITNNQLLTWLILVDTERASESFVTEPVDNNLANYHSRTWS